MSKARLALSIFVALALPAVIVGSAEAALVAYYPLDGNANDVVGGFHGNINGGATFVSSPVGGQAINLNGINQYIDTIATSGTATNLGINGNNPKTITAWARTEAFTNAGLWQIGNFATGAEFSLRTTTATNGWLAQFWGTPDFGFSAPGSQNNWSHFAVTHDGSVGRAYYNGVEVASKASTLSTADTNPLTIGRWHPSWPPLQGQVDEVRVYNHALSADDVAKQYTAAGGYAEGFDGSNALPGDWYVSSGMNSTRVRTNRGGRSGNLLSTFDNDGSDPAGNVRNVYNVHQDHVTSQSFGPVLGVKDDTASLSFLIAGGGVPVNEGSQRGGGLAVVLWDLEANDYVRDGGVIRSVTRSGNGGLQAQSISLAGLKGRNIMPVLYDRQIGGWGWVEIDSLSAPVGSVLVGNPAEHHRVRLDYHFDNAGDFMGWTGNLGSFQIGNTPGGLATRHINLKGVHTLGEGFLSSTTVAGGWDAPTGTIRSPDFTLQGDIIDFYIAGGNRANLSFELWVDLLGTNVFTLQATATHQADATEFDYDFWAIKPWEGMSGYLQLVDNNPGTWGHIHVDGIRMIEFNVPEPTTLALCGLGLVGLARRRRRRRS